MGYDDEKTPILHGDHMDPLQKPTIKCKHFLMIPLVLAFNIPLGMITYIIPEYFHDRLNEGISNSSILENYTYDACASNKYGSQYDHYTYVQDEIAKWQNYFILIRGVPSIFTSLIWASYSDVIGRKMLMFVCTFGYTLKYAGLSLVVHFKAPFAFLLIGETLDGLLGSIGTYLAVLFAYIADITELGRQRTLTIVMAELLIGISATVTVIGTGYYIQYFGYFYAAVTGFSFSCFACLLALFFLPETLRVKRSGGLRRGMSSVLEALKLYSNQGNRIKQIKYVLLIVAFLFYTSQAINRSSIEALYQLGQPFCWSPEKIGWFGAARVGGITTIGMVIVVVLKKAFADDTIAIFSATLTVGSYVVEGLAQTVSIVYIGFTAAFFYVHSIVPVLAVMSILPIPIIRSLMSQLTPVEKQGAVFASIGSVETACNVLGSLTGNLVYSATMSIFDGFVFFVLGLLALISGCILCVFRWLSRKYPEDTHLYDSRVN